MSLAKEKKAQTSLEYMLLLAGVVIIAIMVALYLKGIPSQAGTEINDRTQHIIGDF